MNKFLLVSFLILVVGLCMDVFSTLYGFQLGLQEQNQFYYTLGDSIFFIAKLSANVLLAVICSIFHKHYGGKTYRFYRQWYPLVALWLLGGFQVFSGVRNLYIILVMPK